MTAATMIHRGWLSLVSAPPAIVAAYDALFPFGFAFTDEWEARQRDYSYACSVEFPLEYTGMQALQCAQALVGHLYPWAALPAPIGPSTPIDEIVAAWSGAYQRLAAHRRRFHATVQDQWRRKTYHFGMLTVSSAMNLAHAVECGAAHAVLSTLETIMTAFSAAIIAGKQPEQFSEQIDYAHLAARSTVSRWSMHWSAPSSVLSERGSIFAYYAQ